MNPASWPSPLAPWLEPALRGLLGNAATLHHGILLYGPAGIGKGGFARHLAAGLFCESPVGHLACGACQACGWMLQLAHPDLRLVIPEALDPAFEPTAARKPSREIRIDQVRALASFMAVGGHRGGWRVVLIDPADAMNHVTANSLLKTLEEPGDRTVLVLVSSHPDRLPATIRSRCRAVRLQAPPLAQARQWLLDHGMPDAASAERALRAAGSPFQALALADPAQMAAHQAIVAALAGLPDSSAIGAVDVLDRHDAHLWAGVLQRWVSDLTRVLAGVEPHYYPYELTRMQGVVFRSDLGRLTALQGRLSSLSARIDHPLNARLLCESTLFAYCDAFDAVRRTR